MFTTPPVPFRKFAHAAIEAGFDIVHGHSSHVTQGVEIYCGRPILYDTGSFIGDEPAGTSFIYLVDVSSSLRFERVLLVPVRLRSGRVNVRAVRGCRRRSPDDVFHQRPDRVTPARRSLTMQDGLQPGGSEGRTSSSG
jgi:hypothetical protein